MAGSDWISRHANMEGLTHASQNGPATVPIACRVCNNIFIDNKELLNHFAVHQVIAQSAEIRQALLSQMMASHRERPAAKRLCLNPPMISAPAYQPRSMFWQNNAPASASSSRPGFPYGTNTRSLNLIQRRQRIASPTSIPFPYAGNVHKLPTSGEPQIVVMLDSRDFCFTRPFLSQLEAKLLVDGMTSIVDKAIGSDEPEDDKTLDLTLRLGIGRANERKEEVQMKD